MSERDGADWAELTAELDRWGTTPARLWWRDDDAVAATPQLADLLRLAAGAPLALAVIPAFVRPELAESLRDQPQVVVLQHGWQHVNRAPPGAKKSEYPSGRPCAAVAAEIAAGRVRLRAVFGARALPIFVPPWNRLGNEFITVVARCGIAALSGMVSPQRPAPRGALPRCDVAVDLAAWHEGGRFIGEAAALAALVRLLRAARLAGAAARPIGLLTHHLIMDDASAAFIARLIDLGRSHRALCWASAADLL